MTSSVSSPDPNSSLPLAAAAAARPTVAVLPAAGFGTRLRPLTDAIPKEMLPLGRRPALEYIVEELTKAGMKRIVFVLSPAKIEFIQKLFGDGADGIAYTYALQPEMRGLGDAILKAEPFTSPGEAFVVALGDAVFEEPVAGGVTTRLINAFVATNAALGLAVQQVPRERLSRYGIVKPAGERIGDYLPISDIVEKPAPENAPSDYAAAARYIVRGEIFEELRRTPPGKGGEIQLTDALCALLQRGARGVAVPLKSYETRHDIGGLDSYFKAFAVFALADPEHGAAFESYLRQRLSDAEFPINSTLKKDPVP